MYALDDNAATATLELVTLPSIQELAGRERVFALMPLMHSESIPLQRLAVCLYERLAKELAGSELEGELAQNVEYAIAHRDIVERFGYFPHRNDILGWSTTDEEAEFLRPPAARSDPRLTPGPLQLLVVLVGVWNPERSQWSDRVSEFLLVVRMRFDKGDARVEPAERRVGHRVGEHLMVRSVLGLLEGLKPSCDFDGDFAHPVDAPLDVPRERAQRFVGSCPRLERGGESRCEDSRFRLHFSHFRAQSLCVTESVGRRARAPAGDEEGRQGQIAEPAHGFPRCSTEISLTVIMPSEVWMSLPIKSRRSSLETKLVAMKFAGSEAR